MSGEKFHLDLTGRPLEGYRTEEVAAALARLLRIPRKRARNLLRGTPSRIKREFEKEKAIHLMGKIHACGAQCDVTLSELQDDSGQETAASIELPEKLELEIDQPEIEREEASVETQEKTETGREKWSASHSGSDVPSLPSGSLSVDSGGEPADQPPSEDETNKDGPQAPEKFGAWRQKSLLIAGVIAVLLGLAVWAGLSFLGGPSPSPAKGGAKPALNQEAVPKAVSELAKTRRRLELLTRSVKIWMIQYGAGFDPSQVTLDRMQQDLGISPEEIKDGWGTLFRYRSAAETFTITSAGPDRTFGSKDDISEEKSVR